MTHRAVFATGEPAPQPRSRYYREHPEEWEALMLELRPSSLGQLAADQDTEEPFEEEPPGLTTAEWAPGAFGSPGFVTDPGRARSTPCIRLELGEGHAPLVYSKGIVGALDEEQQALYCQEGYVDRAITEAQRDRLQAFATAAHECSTEAKAAEPQQHMAAYFSCLGRELKAQGVET